MLNIKVILPENVSRLRNLSFILGLLGLMTWLFPPVERQPSGSYAVDIAGVDIVASSMPVINDGTASINIDRNLSDPDELKQLSELAFTKKTTLVYDKPGSGEEQGKLESQTPVQVDAEDESARGTGYVYVTDPISGYIPAGSIAKKFRANNNFILVASSSLSFSPIYKNNIVYFLSLGLWPFKLLAVFALVWCLYLFVLLMAPIYRTVAQVITILNYIFAFITERSNQDLARYLIRAEYFQWKVLVSLAGISNQIPHIDIYATEKERLPLQFSSGFQEKLSRNAILVRILIIVGYAVLHNTILGLADTHRDTIGNIGYFAIVTFISLPLILIGLLQLIYALLQVIAWLAAGILGKPLAPILHIMFKIQKFLTALNFLIMGLSNNPRLLLEAWSSKIVTEYEDDSDDTETQYDIIEYDPSREAGIEINLLVLYLLVVASASIYTFCWLARVIKLMADDSFTILLLLILSATLFSSYLLPEYYRRTEARRKQSGRVLIEILLMIPVLNLFAGPFIIQYLLNRYEMIKRRQT